MTQPQEKLFVLEARGGDRLFSVNPDGSDKKVGAKRVFLITTGSTARNPAILAPIETAIGDRLVGKTADIAQHAPVREVARAAREGVPRPELQPATRRPRAALSPLRAPQEPLLSGASGRESSAIV